MLFSPFTRDAFYSMHPPSSVKLYSLPAASLPFRPAGEFRHIFLAKVPHSCYTVAENEIHIPQEVQYDNDPRIIRHS